MKHKRFLTLILTAIVFLGIMFSCIACRSAEDDVASDSITGAGDVTDSDGFTGDVEFIEPEETTENKFLSYLKNFLSFLTPRRDEVYVNDEGFLVVNGTQTSYKVEGGSTVCSHGRTHTVEENAVDPLCTTDGSYDKVKYCVACNAEVSREIVVIPAKGHVLSGRYCDICGEEITYVYFGEYPQSIKADGVSITSKKDSRGNYLGSDGYYYAKVVASPYNSGYSFSNGTEVEYGDVYYFKVEPIRWNILAIDGNRALVLCDSIIANKAHGKNYDNNYESSGVRSWLNETFYETAFTELQRELIYTTVVDNSVYSTGYSSNPYACSDTEDKLFLLSYREVTNSGYGFSSGADRQMLTSDYARANGAYMSPYTYSYGCGSWWLRSPYNYDYGYARYVYSDGGFDYSSVGYDSYGVVPAMWINLVGIYNSSCEHLVETTVEENNVDATCTVDGGYDEVVYCADCYVELSREHVVTPAVGHDISGARCNNCDEVIYTRDGSYIYFGEYPQTVKADSVTITGAQDERGYYLGDDGNYYAMVVADPYDSYTFSNGYTAWSGNTYYFKVEPIRWRILTTNGNNALIVCDSIIENQRYNDYYNDYADSEVRKWLNENFYETAFSKLQKDLILTTTVDNSVYSTGYSSNSYACENTYDKLFLLSYREVTNSEYGFASSYSSYDASRQMSTTDYVRATGIYVRTDSSYNGNAYWVLRSPYNLKSNYVRVVDYDGTADGVDYVYAEYLGIVPALWIAL